MRRPSTCSSRSPRMTRATGRARSAFERIGDDPAVPRRAPRSRTTWARSGSRSAGSGGEGALGRPPRARRLASADLRGLAEDRPWLGAAPRGGRDAAGSTSWRTRIRTAWRRSSRSPRHGMRTSTDSRRSSATRSSGRRRSSSRRRGRSGSSRPTTATLVIPLLDRFVELHRMSEGPKGVFMVPGMEIFFRRLGEAFCAEGVFRLTMIEVGGGARRRDDRVRLRSGPRYLYNSAFDRSLGRAGAGHGARGRGHPTRDRGRERGVRSAEGRLRVQVPVRRRASAGAQARRDPLTALGIGADRPEDEVGEHGVAAEHDGARLQDGISATASSPPRARTGAHARAGSRPASGSVAGLLPSRGPNARSPRRRLRRRSGRSCRTGRDPPARAPTAACARPCRW